MTDPIDDLATRIVRLERQNRRRSSQLEHSSLVDGSLREFDGSEQPNQVAQYGKQYDGTSAAVTLVSPPPPAPSTPTVTPMAGGLIVAWDGTFENDITVVAPMDWRQVDVVVGAVGMDPIATPPSVGITSPRGGEFFVAVPPGDYDVALVSRTLAGRPSAPSASVTATALPLVDSAQFDQALEDLTEAQGRLDTVATDLDANEAELEAAKVRLAKAEQDAIDALADALSASQAASQASLDAADAESLAGAANTLAGQAKTAADSKVTVYRQSSAPTGPSGTFKVGSAPDLWIDSDDGIIYYTTATTGVWSPSPDQRVAAVVASNATKTTIFTQTSQPPTTGRTTGDAWVDTDDENKLYVWDGAWTLRRDALITAANNLAQQAKSAADSKITVYRQSSAPTGTFVVNDLWLDIDDGLLYYASTTSGGWTLHSDQRIGLVVASNATKTTVFAQISAPSTTGRTVGDLWIDTDDGNRVYDWSGSWTARPLGAAAISATARQLGATLVFRQSTAPTGTFVIGDLWLDSDDGLLYITTSTTGTWVLHSDQRIAAVVDSNATKISVFTQTSQPPTSGRTAGDMWIDIDDDNRPYVWDGAWTNRRDVTIAAANLASLNQLAGGYGELDGMLGSPFNIMSGVTVFDAVDKPDETRGVFGCPAGGGTSSVPSGDRSRYWWDVEPGSEYLVEIWLKADKPNSRIYIELRDQGFTTMPFVAVPGLPYAGSAIRPVDNHVVPTAWTKYYAVAKPGATVTKMQLGSIFFNHANGTERTAVQKFAIRVRPRVSDKNLVSLDLDKLVVTGTTNMNIAVAEHVASKTAAFQTADIGNLFVTATSTLNTVVAQRLAAEVAEFITVRANNLEATMALVTTLTSGTTGRRWEADAAGIRVIDADGTILIAFPTDSATPASFYGDLVATSLSITDQFALRGLINEISRGSQLILASGTTAPSAAPTIVIDLENYTASVDADGSSAYDPYRTGWTRSGNYYYTITAIYTAGQIIHRHAVADGARDLLYSITPETPAIWSNASVTIIGNVAYVLGLNKDATAYRVHGYDLTSKAKVADWAYSHAFGTSGTAHRKPVIGTDGTNVMIAFTNYDTSLVQWRYFNPSTGAQVGSTVISDFVTGQELTSIGRTAADFGSDRVFITVPGSHSAFFMTTAGVYQVNETFPLGGAGTRGFSWDASLSRFVSLDASGARFYRYVPTKWTTESATWWVSNTWYDGDVAGTGTHETGQGPKRSFTMKKRWRLTVTTAPLPVRPIPNTPDDAKAARLYIGRGAGEPARTSMELVSTMADGSRNATLTSITLPSGAAASPPPATSDFPASSPGRVASADGTSIVIAGDGSFTLGRISRTAAGAMAISGEGWTAPTLGTAWVNYGGAAPNQHQDAGYRKLLNGTVEIRGMVKSGTVSTIFTLPVGFRPLKNETFIQLSNTGSARVEIFANGNVVVTYLTGGSNAFVSLAGIRFDTLA